MKKLFFTCIQPVMVVVALLLWYHAPSGWVENPLALTIAMAVTTFLILGLEWVNERHASWRLTKKEFFTDLFYLVLNATVIGWASTKLADDPLKALKGWAGITTQWAMHMPFVAQVALVVLLVEFGQYWMHRLMHNSTPFWLTHAPHHHLTQLNAMKGAVGNPIELFLISLSVVALFDLPLAAIFCAFNVLAIVSTFAHANTRCDPPRWYGFFFTTIQNHSLHHSVGYEETRCNYANSLILLDRIFGTYRPGESEAVGQDERRRLSIREQMLFPFQPLIARMAGAPAPDKAEAGAPETLAAVHQSWRNV